MEMPRWRMESVSAPPLLPCERAISAVYLAGQLCTNGNLTASRPASRPLESTTYLSRISAKLRWLARLFCSARGLAQLTSERARAPATRTSAVAVANLLRWLNSRRVPFARSESFTCAHLCVAVAKTQVIQWQRCRRRRVERVECLERVERAHDIRSLGGGGGGEATAQESWPFARGRKSNGRDFDKTRGSCDAPGSPLTSNAKSSFLFLSLSHRLRPRRSHRLIVYAKISRSLAFPRARLRKRS